MVYLTPKLNWTVDDEPDIDDFNRIEGNIDYLQDRVQYYSTTILTTNWSGSEPASCVKTISGILNTDTPIIDVDLSNANDFDDEMERIIAYSLIYRAVVTANNQITFYAIDEPSVDIDLKIKVVRE